ncbi:hypothetical protein [Streptomyces sp. SID12501]|uniref:DUF4760 domain-containing protein n=1 Tax=Streptomyces sp. SID12501 TaxID=2706042 RepID=A0A6B3BNW6_9ACTN|nr:hypothetical protein [Streptomyces sp. SID12501]NEC86032.1 hypothetical protein [Streptomyces sp. SID12501]
MGEIFGVIASIGVVASLLVSSWQTRELTRQTSINNVVAGVSAMYNGMERLHHIESFFAAEPWLYGHFYGGASLPDDEDRRVRVLAIAGMLADVVDYGIVITELNPDIKFYAGWRDFALSLRCTSPAMVHLIEERPTWWAALNKYWAEHPEPSA